MNIIQKIYYYSYSLLFCLRYLPLKQAIHIPLLIHPRVRIDKMYRGAICIHGKLKHSMFVIGWEGTIGRSNCHSLISIGKGGKLVLGEMVQMARGTRIVIGQNAELAIGNNFWCNGDCFFNCTTKISIGDNNMYGWNVNFNTTDGHHVYVDGASKPMEGEIVIGNHVWIASYCNITKNSFIADDCMVAQNSLVGKRFDSSHCLIGGLPAKVLKENVSWTTY